MPTKLRTWNKDPKSRLAIVLLITALPTFTQPASREDIMTPWLSGDPDRTERLLAGAMQAGHFAIGLRLAVEFEIERGNYVQARRLLAQASGIDARDLLQRREAKLRAATGDFVGAEKAALEGRRWDGRKLSKLSSLHPISINALGEAYAARGLHEQAIGILARSRERSSLYVNHAEFVEAKVLTVFSHLALGNPQAALVEAEEALSSAQKQWGPNGPRTLDAADALGVTLLELGRLEEADQWLSLALKSRQELYVHAHPKTAASYIHYARLLAARHEDAKALEVAEAGLRIQGTALPEANARTALLLAEAADVCKAAGRPAEAREKLENAIRVLALFLGDEAPSVQTANRKWALVR